MDCGTYTVEECRTGIPSELEGGKRENRDKRTRKILEYHPDVGHSSTMFTEQTWGTEWLSE
jgi:hypothetical protein